MFLSACFTLQYCATCVQTASCTENSQNLQATRTSLARYGQGAEPPHLPAVAVKNQPYGVSRWRPRCESWAWFWTKLSTAMHTS